MKTMTNLALLDVHLADDEIRILSRGASPTNLRPHKLKPLYPRHRAQDKPLQMNDSRDGCHSHEWGLTLQNTWSWVNSKELRSERKSSAGHSTRNP